MSGDIIIYFFALLIGIFLGIMGSGGAILIVPILVYISGFTSSIATTYSLFIVTITSLLGLIAYYRNNLINIRDTLYFTIPSFLSAFLVRTFVFHNIPDILFQINSLALTKNRAIMLSFAVLMLATAITMIISRRDINVKQDENTPDLLKIILIGIITGATTSLTGAGGGFIIVPTLVFLLGLSMKITIGLSLFIITCNAFMGFLGDLVNKISIEWNYLLAFTMVTVVGFFIGNYLYNYISGTRLRIIFGYFLVCMTFFIVIKELIVR